MYKLMTLEVYACAVVGIKCEVRMCATSKEVVAANILIDSILIEVA